ncbi:MAG: DNA polymerase III subunit gamma/tau [Bacillota bacterium]
MGYLALYRQWRPQGFKEVVGQEHVVRTLRNALIAQRFGHAYLFAGPRGTGKTSIAKILAKAVNCQDLQQGEPCNRCLCCQQISAGSSLDVLEIDAASNRGIDEIRDLREKVKLAPAASRYRVYIIDEVHMLTTEAFNALLKTLEEPPPHAVFVLATTEPQKLPLTILSRCQRLDFRRLNGEEMEERLREVVAANGASVHPEAIRFLARMAGGGMRDALSLLDQCLTYAGQEISLADVREMLGVVDTELLLDLAVAVGQKDLSRVLLLVDSGMAAGKDVRRMAGDLAGLFRDLLMLKLCKDEHLLTFPIEITQAYDLANNFAQEHLVEIIDELCRIEGEMKWSAYPRVLLETTLLKVSDASGRIAVKALADRISLLEQQLNELRFSGAGVVSANKPPVKGAEPVREGGKMPFPAAKPAAVRSTAGSLRSRWSEVLEGVKKTKITAYAFLVEAELVEEYPGEIVLGFRAGHVFHKERIEQAENRQVVEQVLQNVLGYPVRLKFQMLSLPENQAAKKPEPEPGENIHDLVAEVFNE